MIIQGDCVEVLKGLDISADLCIVDPPFYQVVKNDWDNQWNSEQDYLNWIHSVIDTLNLKIKDTGTIYFYMKPQFIHKITPILDNYFIMKNQIVINVRKATNIPKHRLRLHWMVLYMGILKEKENTFNIQYKPVPDHLVERYSKIGYNVKRGQPIDDVWTDLPPASDNNIYHPSRKSLAICERIINLSSNPGDLVLIPFAGSGSECVAAKKLNREFIGIELSEDYCKLTNKRLLSV